MSYEIKENSGSLFRNDKKEKESHPDYKGSANIAGLEYWVSAWVNTKNGKSWMSFKYQLKDGQQVAAPAPKYTEPEPLPEFPPIEEPTDLPF